MKKKGFSFIDFGHALGRSEMKKLMAGSDGDDCWLPCREPEFYPCCCSDGRETCYTAGDPCECATYCGQPC